MKVGFILYTLYVIYLRIYEQIYHKDKFQKRLNYKALVALGSHNSNP